MQEIRDSRKTRVDRNVDLFHSRAVTSVITFPEKLLVQR